VFDVRPSTHQFHRVRSIFLCTPVALTFFLQLLLTFSTEPTSCTRAHLWSFLLTHANNVGDSTRRRLFAIGISFAHNIERNKSEQTTNRNRKEPSESILIILHEALYSSRSSSSSSTMGGTRDTTATPCVNASTLFTTQANNMKVEESSMTDLMLPPPTTTNTEEDDDPIIIPTTTTTIRNSSNGSHGHRPPSCLSRRHSSPDPQAEAVIAAMSTTSTSSSKTKRVSFSSLEIRNYDIVIGDHPCCMMGCPISLGWDYSPAKRHLLDQYEAGRQGMRRNRSQLRLTCDERQTILLSWGNTSETDLRKAGRKLHRSRSCTDHSARLHIQEHFFQSE
jgi:hypothetical protein